MKTVYLVRHGESEANLGDTTLVQGETSPLTERGKGQARAIAERVARLQFDVLVASTAVRAQETARIIAEHTGHIDIETCSLMTERIIPQQLLGKERHSPEVQRMLETWGTAFFDDSVARTSDGENFVAIKQRAAEALAYLEGRPEQRILVVTHGFFLRVLLAYVMFGDALTAQECRQFLKATRTKNTGMTVLSHGLVAKHAIDPGEVRWLIRVFNDHAHLG